MTTPTSKQRLIEAVKGRKAYIGTIYETPSNYDLFRRNELIDDILKSIEEILPNE